MTPFEREMQRVENQIRMKPEIAPLIWFLVGSVCLLIGTILNIIYAIKK